MKIIELPPERVKLPLDQVRKHFVFRLMPPGRLGCVYSTFTHGISKVSPGIHAWGEKRAERKALRAAARMMRRWRLTEAYVEFWYWPDGPTPYRVVKVEL